MIRCVNIKNVRVSAVWVSGQWSGGSDVAWAQVLLGEMQRSGEFQERGVCVGGANSYVCFFVSFPLPLLGRMSLGFASFMTGEELRPGLCLSGSFSLQCEVMPLPALLAVSFWLVGHLGHVWCLP